MPGLLAPASLPASDVRSLKIHEPIDLGLLGDKKIGWFGQSVRG